MKAITNLVKSEEAIFNKGLEFKFSSQQMPYLDLIC